MWNNLLNFFAGGTKSRELRDMEALYDKIKAAFDASEYTDDKFGAFRVGVILEAGERAERIPIDPLINAIGRLVGDLVDLDFLLYGFPDRPHFETLTAHEGVDLRTYLKRKERFLSNPAHLLVEWRSPVVGAIAGVLKALPATLFKEDWDDPDPTPTDGPTVPLVDLLDSVPEIIERLYATFVSDMVLKADVFPELREQLDRRACLASGIEWHERFETERKFVPPSAYTPDQPDLVAAMYLDGTPWKRFFDTRLPLSIPFPVRFEHTHIVGGSGHGKTQLLQLGILRDLEASIEDNRSVVVIDSQGDLIRNISRLSLFAPDDPSGLADRLLIVDPTDVEYPVALNMFDFDRGSMGRLPMVDRERLLNATIDLYEYFFGALLGAELTARQGIIFKYIARLLLEIPDATIHTFRELMEDGEPFRPYMERLPPTARAFFETRFFDRTFNETKKQVLTRLWGVLSNATFDRMFSHPRSKVDMYGALQSGKIVLVNTAKELLGHEGASILGRFFIALIAQASQRRATVPQHERNPAFVYIDEAADYFDVTVDHLLNQARKYKVGMVLAHQNLDQLSTSLRASIFASTSIKYAGGVSSRDATVFASEMRSERDFLESMRKLDRETMFACHVRNVTPQALAVSVPLGVVEREPKISNADWQVVQAANRAAYCISLEEVPAAQFRPARKAEPRKERRDERAPTKAELGAEGAALHGAGDEQQHEDGEQDDLPVELGQGERDGIEPCVARLRDRVEGAQDFGIDRPLAGGPRFDLEDAAREAREGEAHLVAGLAAQHHGPFVVDDRLRIGHQAAPQLRDLLVAITIEQPVKPVDLRCLGRHQRVGLAEVALRLDQGESQHKARHGEERGLHAQHEVGVLVAGPQVGQPVHQRRQGEDRAGHQKGAHCQDEGLGERIQPVDHGPVLARRGVSIEWMTPAEIDPRSAVRLGSHRRGHAWSRQQKEESLR
ncbi:type IV secretory system conjugative DNA transfer family protein [Reyranella sp.]|uniref:type IV secretory system conjugative DNA transfer family protein n=1 Tax=Reyranella sp. TaxID=1929291 RepID=UPI002721F66E|nr:hypothetical protein [Reyranella sp.]MDO8973949.1 hypothetical protein [Reyranella sp.]